MPDIPRNPSPPDALVAAAVGRAARAGGPGCLDADTLAAYYERALDPAETTRADAHVASCLACQARLAALARSEMAAGAGSAEAAPWWRSLVASPWRWAWMAPALALVAVVWLAERPAPIPTPELTVASRSAAPAAPQAPPPAAAAETPSRPSSEEKLQAMAAPPPKAAGAVAQADTAAAAPRNEAARREPAAEAQAFAGAAAKAEKRAVAPVMLAAPGGQVVWRITGDGVIARSDDGGATWREQASTGAALTAGSPVSATVCWAAGRAGAIWRTTDGERWEQTAPPAAADLTAITATDASHAEVTTADGRRFQTADGGKTWNARGMPTE